MALAHLVWDSRLFDDEHRRLRIAMQCSVVNAKRNVGRGFKHDTLTTNSLHLLTSRPGPMKPILILAFILSLRAATRASLSTAYWLASSVCAARLSSTSEKAERTLWR